MDTNLDVTIYHILFRIQMRIRILSNPNTNGYFEFGFAFEYLLDLYNEYQFYLWMVL
jgi:hypothetical protein